MKTGRKTDFSRGRAIIIAAAFITVSCTQQATPAPVDVIGTAAMELAIVMLTQTAAANTPTPESPTATETPAFTETPEGTPTDKPAPKPPAVIAIAGCWTGPGENYTLISHIEPNANGRKNVVILGIGSEPGWYVIRNPYFNNPCWIREENLAIDPLMDLTQFPPMTPGAP